MHSILKIMFIGLMLSKDGMVTKIIVLLLQLINYTKKYIGCVIIQKNNIIFIKIIGYIGRKQTRLNLNLSFASYNANKQDF
jgi:hypothetical protein